MRRCAAHRPFRFCENRLAAGQNGIDGGEFCGQRIGGCTLLVRFGLCVFRELAERPAAALIGNKPAFFGAPLAAQTARTLRA